MLLNRRIAPANAGLSLAALAAALTFGAPAFAQVTDESAAEQAPLEEQAIVVTGDWIGAMLAAGLACVGGYQWIDARRANGCARLSEEERAFGAAMLPRLAKAQLRGLLDQGYWLRARPGDILTREGEPVPHLYYIAEGGVTVHSAGSPVGACGAESFVGEVTVLSGDPATGTVEVEAPSRLWCVPAPKLRLYAEQNDEIRRALDTAFRQSLTAKLVAANRRATR